MYKTTKETQEKKFGFFYGHRICNDFYQHYYAESDIKHLFRAISGYDYDEISSVFPFTDIRFHKYVKEKDYYSYDILKNIIYVFFHGVFSGYNQERYYTEMIDLIDSLSFINESYTGCLVFEIKNLSKNDVYLVYEEFLKYNPYLMFIQDYTRIEYFDLCIVFNTDTKISDHQNKFKLAKERIAFIVSTVINKPMIDKQGLYNFFVSDDGLDFANGLLISPYKCTFANHKSNNDNFSKLLDIKPDYSKIYQSIDHSKIKYVLK